MILSAARRCAERGYPKVGLRLAIWKQREIRLILGAGGSICEGFVSTEHSDLDICSRASFVKFLRPGTVGIFLAEHVWEHLSLGDGARAFANCYEFLKRGGVLRIAVPDGFHPDVAYLDSVRPGGCGAGADDHKVLYNFRTLSALLEDAGFRVKLLEWFDEQGQFRYESWDVWQGMVRRSLRFDCRNVANSTTYTSLIIDATKP